VIPVVLSGGSGSRLWPISRQAYPKQFCELLDESLFNKTVNRLKPLGSPWVITVRDMKTLTERSFKELGIPTSQVIFEPKGKNTAAAVALVCRYFELRNQGSEVVGIFPADHLIPNEAEFHAAVRAGEKIAADGQIVTLGIKPTEPATGYGYIETNGPYQKSSVALNAIGFREKPNVDTARGFLLKGGFYWNAGMFIFRVQTMIDLLKKHAPDIYEMMSGLKADLSNLDEIYKNIRATSIDYALMERLPSHVCIPCSFQWSDLGSWDAISEVLALDPKRKVSTVAVESNDNFVLPHDSKTYAFIGVEDLIVVDTADALLIAKRGQTEMVRELVDKLKAAGNTNATQHRFEIRPWGRFEILSDNDEYKAKTIMVDPGAQISYQSHTKRAEHWVILSGAGEVTLNEEIVPVKAGGHVHVPTGTKHRIRNTGTEPLRFVEVQTGSYFGEDDIIRYEDIYGRK
jgi:mannose-1-phosphate guanylyltransferase/mannose-1-phosphate guanylyltransferase/mannose-6-phosphate isomerase